MIIKLPYLQMAEINFKKNAWGHNKKFNKKKLQNLLDKAVREGSAEVTILNRKKGTSRTITTFDLEQYINQHIVDRTYIKHPLSSTLPKDIIPWYKDSVELELVYKNQLDEKFVASGNYEPLGASSNLKYICSPVEDGIKYTNVMHNISVTDEQQKQHIIQYTLHVQKFPANAVFATHSIDLYTYNLGYIYVAERKHNTTLNSNIVNFVSQNEEHGFLTFYSDQQEMNNETGLKNENDSIILSYVTMKTKSGDDLGKYTYLTLEQTTYNVSNNEMWYFPSNNVKIYPKYTSINNKQDLSNNMRTPHTKFGVTCNGLINGSYELMFKPYTFEWTDNEEYTYCFTYSSHLVSPITVNIHPIRVRLDGVNVTNVVSEDTDIQDTQTTTVVQNDNQNTQDIQRDNLNEQNETTLEQSVSDEPDDTQNTDTQNTVVEDDDISGYDDEEDYFAGSDINSDTGSDFEENEIESVYLSKSVTIDLSKKMKYKYNFDNTGLNEYDLSQNISSTKYIYTIKDDEEKIVASVNMPILSTKSVSQNTDIKLSPTFSQYSSVRLDLERKLKENFDIKTYSVLKNPLTMKRCCEYKNLLNHVQVKSKPVLSLNTEEQNKIVEVLTCEYNDDNTLSLTGKFAYDVFINNIASMKNTNGDIYELNDGNIINVKSVDSFAIDSVIYTLSIAGAGFVKEIANGKEFAYEGKLTYLGTSETTQRHPLEFKYSYYHNNDNTKITQPNIVVESEPQYSIVYIGNKGIAYIISDDFDITSDLKPFNDIDNINIEENTDTENTTKYGITKNSYIVCELEDNVEKNLDLYYEHKSDNITSTKKVVGLKIKNDWLAYNGNVSNNYEYNTVDKYASTQWQYTYTMFNAYNRLLSNVNENINCVNSEVTKYDGFKLNNVDDDNDNQKTRIEYKIKDQVGLDPDNFVNTIIPNEIFAALYTKIGTQSMTSGFMFVDKTSTDEDIESIVNPYDTFGGSTLDVKYKLTPIFDPDNADTNSIHMNTIDGVFERKIGSQKYEPISVWTKYYLCTSSNSNDSYYYLCCVITNPADKGSATITADTLDQILPVFVYRLNMYSATTNDEHTNLIPITDYEYVNEEGVVGKKYIKYPQTIEEIINANYYTTYMMYGFSEDILRKIYTDNEPEKTNIRSIYETIPQEGWVLKNKSDNNVYCKVKFNYDIDENGKLRGFSKTLSEQAYTYANKYTDRIRYGLDSIQKGVYPYNVVYDNNGKPMYVEFETVGVEAKYKPISGFSDLCAYISVNYQDNEKIYECGFKINKNDANIACKNETGKYNVEFNPELISDYTEVFMPKNDSTEYPKYDTFTSKYNK